MQIRIGGVLVRYQAGSLSVDDAIGERSTCSFIVIDTPGTARFQDAQPVEIFDAVDTLIFRGFIDKIQEKRVSPFQPHMLHHISCKDNHYLADKRIVARAYISMTAGAIVRDILTTVLASEGVVEGTPATIQAGPLVREAVINYAPAAEALDALAEQAGFAWWIDANRILHFVARATYTAPWSAAGADMAVGSVNVTVANPKYRNRQYMKGVRDTTDPQTEIRRGDGVNRAFTVGFPVAQVPTVEVSLGGGAWTAQTVGIKGVETGRHWYWSKGDAVITQDWAQPVLGTADQVRIIYRGEFDVVVLSQDQAAIFSRQTTEGIGSGIVEDVAGMPDVSSRDTAFQTAAAKLRTYAQLGRRIKFTTRRVGLRPGQLLRITLPEHGINNLETLVESVNVSAPDAGVVLYTVTAVDGPAQGSWSQLFAGFARKDQALIELINIGRAAVLVILADTRATWPWTVSTAQRVFACPIPSTALFPSATLFPC